MKIAAFILLFSLISSCSSASNGDNASSSDPGVNTNIPPLTDQEALDQVQKDALKYFWDR